MSSRIRSARPISSLTKMPWWAGWNGLSLATPSAQLVARPSPVAPLQVQQPGGQLDQALVEVALVVRRGAPQRLPRLVGVPVADAVEQRDAAPEQLVRVGSGQWRRSSTGQVVRSGPMDSTIDRDPTSRYPGC